MFSPSVYHLKNCVVISSAEVKVISVYSGVCTRSRKGARGKGEDLQQWVRANLKSALPTQGEEMEAWAPGQFCHPLKFSVIKQVPGKAIILSF